MFEDIFKDMFSVLVEANDICLATNCDHCEFFKYSKEECFLHLKVKRLIDNNCFPLAKCIGKKIYVILFGDSVSEMIIDKVEITNKFDVIFTCCTKIEERYYTFFYRFADINKKWFVDKTSAETYLKGVK